MWTYVDLMWTLCGLNVESLDFYLTKKAAGKAAFFEKRNILLPKYPKQYVSNY